MSNRIFEMYEYRQVVVRLRQGDSDRDPGGWGDARSNMRGFTLSVT